MGLEMGSLLEEITFCVESLYMLTEFLFIWDGGAPDDRKVESGVDYSENFFP